MNESGVATIVIVIAVVAGATATPVVADSVDVPPDHPLYGLERSLPRIWLSKRLTRRKIFHRGCYPERLRSRSP